MKPALALSGVVTSTLLFVLGTEQIDFPPFGGCGYTLFFTLV